MSIDNMPRPQTVPEQGGSEWDSSDQALFDLENESAQPDTPEQSPGTVEPQADEGVDDEQTLYELNREDIDRRILGKSVRLKEDIRSTAGETVSKGDELFAKMRYLP